MYLIDSSAWIEYLRRTGSRADSEVTRLVHAPGSVAITEPVIMELLAGARGARDFRGLSAMTSALPLMAVEAVCDYPEAAAIYKLLRYSGLTVRSLVDCLIAAVAMRRDATVVHSDADFDVIASRLPLKVLSLL